jgi:DNA-binding PadR family transcriptional regulator
MKVMRTEDLKKIILRISGSGEFYGYKIHKQLASRKIVVSTSRLYRTLAEMVRQGLLESQWQKGQLGPRQRVYKLGEKGRKEREKILLDAIATVHGFYSEYLLNLPAKTNVFNTICRILSGNLSGKPDIGYVTSDYSEMHERLLRGLRGEIPGANIYFVKPASLAVDLNLENLWFLNGTYDSIPLKQGYVDLLVIVGVPHERFLEKSLKEWLRVLKQSGTLAICVPTVFTHKHDDPLSVGNFIEKYEHKTLEEGQHIETDYLKTLLKKSFQRVEEKQIVHITVFLACSQH